MQIVAVAGEGVARTATLEADGVTKERVPLFFNDPVSPGDWVLVHLNQAIARAEADDAMQARALIREMEAADDE